MLPCQHTFCLNCLHSHLMAHRVLIKQQSLDSQNAVSKKPAAIKCPVCQKRVDLEKGVESLADLPKNLYIDSVMKLVAGDISPISTKSDNRCVKCHTFSQQEEQCCQHCMQVPEITPYPYRFIISDFRYFAMFAGTSISPN